MSEYISAITPNTDLTVADFDGRGPGTSSDFKTGDIRRKYNFGDKVSELALAQDPFFRFVSQVAKKPTDDPQFKWAEKRESYHKRYAYVGAAKDNTGAFVTSSDIGAAKSQGDNLELRMITDFKNQGNIQNVFGSTGDDIHIGEAGTMPKFFLPGQLLKIPTAASAGGAATGYMVAKINSVTEHALAGSGNDATAFSNNPDMVALNLTVIKGSTQYLTAVTNIDDGSYVPSTKSISSVLEPMRCYVMGSAHEEGSGYPETWKDQPYSTNIGLSQIWKTSCAMTNTARATVLKYEPNEWARMWQTKLVEHKYDIEQALLFGSQGTVNNVQYTQGAVDYITNFGNTFSLDPNTKTADDFLDDMSNYLDPRYNNSTATVFFCSTAIYNWLHKLGGYFSNNLNINSNFSADLAVTGRKKVLGLDTTNISTPFGDMNVVRNIHLDGTNVKILGINMKHCYYRPLVGNGVNRDTSVYVGVQTLENTGIDRRVDLILTEAGMEWQMPETHAIWS